MGELSEVAHLLRRELTLFEPTTIDELRFPYQGTIDRVQVTIPRLSDPWPLPSASVQDLMYVAPDQRVSDFGSEWAKEGAELGRKLMECNLQPDEQHRISRASPLVRLLMSDITMQIKARDFSLVFQADCVAAYRPMLGGHVSGGVRQELEFHDSLVKAGLGRAIAVVMHPPTDEAEWRLFMFRALVENWVSTGDIETNDIATLLSGISVEVVDTILGASSVTAVGDSLEENLSELGASLTASSGGALGAEAAHQIVQLKRRLAQDLRDNVVSYIDGLEDNEGFEIIRDELTGTEFADRVLYAVRS